MSTGHQKHWPRDSRVWFGLGGLALIAVCIGLAIFFWDWLHPDTPQAVSRSETIRNLALIVGGLLAFVFAWWRALVAERQADAARSQVETAQQSLLNERYQQGAEMLGNGVLPVRLGGIYALQRLAEEHTEQYQILILRLFCAFVRGPDGDEATPTRRTVNSVGVLQHSLRQDVQAAVEGISSMLTAGVSGDGETAFCVNLRGARLNGIHLDYGNLSGVDLSYAELVRADLENTQLWGAQLRIVQLQDSNLRGTDLTHATIVSADLVDVDMGDARLDQAYVVESKLDGAIFYGASLAGTVFSNTRITQAQLDQARINPDDPPVFLDDAVDHSTGKPLNWHGEPIG